MARTAGGWGCEIDTKARRVTLPGLLLCDADRSERDSAAYFA